MPSIGFLESPNSPRVTLFVTTRVRHAGDTTVQPVAEARLTSPVRRRQGFSYGSRATAATGPAPWGSVDQPVDLGNGSNLPPAGSQHARDLA